MNRKHKWVYRLLRRPVSLFLKLKFGYRYQLAKDLPEQYIVLSNHATDYDPILVGVSFPKQMYFVASEHITRWGLAYQFLKWGFEPIIRHKVTIAASTVMDVLRKVRKGGSVCMFAEGGRTWDGETLPIHPSTAKLIKASRCALVTYRLVGGYFTSPMWSSSKKTRRGPLEGAPVRVYTKEEVAAMSEEEVMEAIERDLYEDAYARQLRDPKRYRGRELAKGLEKYLFLCPACRAHNCFETEGNTVRCGECGLQFSYDEYGMLHEAPFDTVKDFAAWQKQEVERDVEEHAVYTASTATISAVTKQTAELLSRGELELSAQGLRCGELSFALSEVPDLAMHGKDSLVFSANGSYYEIVCTENAYRFWLYYTLLKQTEKTEFPEKKG